MPGHSDTLWEIPLAPSMPAYSKLYVNSVTESLENVYYFVFSERQQSQNAANKLREMR